MTKKLLSLIICLFMLNGFLISGEVDTLKAKVIAQQFFSANKKYFQNISSPEGSVFTTAYTRLTEVKSSEKSNRQIPMYFIFNNKNDSGFIIISGDDRIIPVLGYSFEGKFDIDDISPGLNIFLNEYDNQIKNFLNDSASVYVEKNREWVNFKSNNNVLTSPVGPLLKSLWDQTSPYNDLCPWDYEYDKKTPTGCVATAMAQILKYWSFPKKGEGEHSYDADPYGIQTAKFGQTYYYWDSMPVPRATKANKHVATLMYHCGVSVDMIYGVDQSGIYDIKPVITAMNKYFHYDRKLSYRKKVDFNDSDWVNLLKSEINNNRPVLYSGLTSDYKEGHAFVCDGYNITTNVYFHMNWGWGGKYNCNVLVSKVVPYQTTLDFSTSQDAITGIEPDTSYYKPKIIEIADTALVIGPNPFNPGKENLLLKYTIASSQNIDIAVYDIYGRKIDVILNEYQDKGYHSYLWNKFGLKSGIYFIRYRGNDSKIFKVVVV